MKSKAILDKNGKVPTWAVREYLKRKKLSVIDINWKYLKRGLMPRILKEELKKEVKGDE